MACGWDAMVLTALGRRFRLVTVALVSTAGLLVSRVSPVNAVIGPVERTVLGSRVVETVEAVSWVEVWTMKPEDCTGVIRVSNGIRSSGCIACQTRRGLISKTAIGVRTSNGRSRK